METLTSGAMTERVVVTGKSQKAVAVTMTGPFRQSLPAVSDATATPSSPTTTVEEMLPQLVARRTVRGCGATA